MSSVQIITPYINDTEILKHKELFSDLDVYYEKDVSKIGSDLMFQKMWKKFPTKDIFILHADMFPYYDNWYSDMLTYVDKYQEAGMFGLLLLYPATANGKHIVQSAGGTFTSGIPDHYGSGYSMYSNTTSKPLMLDENLDSVREVAWTTFGGCYLRRSFINSVGDFSPDYEWTYNRDVDYCLKARKAGQKIYQIPVRLLHMESRDNLFIKQNDQEKNNMEFRNLQQLQKLWQDTEFYKPINREIQ